MRHNAQQSDNNVCFILPLQVRYNWSANQANGTTCSASEDKNVNNHITCIYVDAL